MEEGTEQVVSGGGAGSVNVSLHPLVVMNVSDHFTRVKVQSQVPPSIISGIYIYIYIYIHAKWAATRVYRDLTFTSLCKCIEFSDKGKYKGGTTSD